MLSGSMLSTALLLAAALAPCHAATYPAGAPLPTAPIMAGAASAPSPDAASLSAPPSATAGASAEEAGTASAIPATDTPPQGTWAQSPLAQGISAPGPSPTRTGPRTGHDPHDHGPAISPGTHDRAAHGHTGPAPHRPSLKEKLAQTEQALSGEQDDRKAQSLMKKAETLRLFTVENGDRLLLTAAQDALRQGHVDEAEKTLSAAITLQPDNAFLRRQRAAIRLIGNDLTGAVEDLQQALVQDPGDAQSWDLLAHTQERLHHPGQALHAYTEALTHAPLLPGGQTRYRQLEEQAHGRPD